MYIANSVCPGCGKNKAPGEDFNLAMLALHDPEEPDKVVLAHEYGVCQECYAKQYQAFYKGGKRSTISKVPLDGLGVPTEVTDEATQELLK